MKKFFCIILTLGVLISCNKNKETKMDMSNPFFANAERPYGIPAFEQIETKHFMPAFEEGMKQQKEEIRAITSNPEEPDFKNTIEALEYTGELLQEVSACFFNLLETNNSPEMNEIAETVSPILSAHEDDIYMNEPLFERIKTVYQKREELDLTQEQKRLLEETYKHFIRGGVNLSEEKQNRFRSINEQIAVLTVKFSNNVLAATNAYRLVIEDSADLAGLPSSVIEAAAEAAKEASKEGEDGDNPTGGKWVFTTQNPSLLPFLQYADNREKRQMLWEAYSTRCKSGEYNNLDLIKQIVSLRAERAHLLGYATHADYVLDDNMAKTPKAVYDLLLQVWKPALAKAKEEAAAYQAMIKKEKGNFVLEPWDWRYYEEKVRKSKYDLSDEECRPYFQMEHVRKGIFTLVERLYGLNFVKNSKLPLYHPEAEAYEVYENDTLLGVIYMDYFTRASKRSGAWMTEFRTQHRTEDGENVIPIISLVFNFPRPTASTPSLLNFDEAETFFHEFGHGLHALFSRCQYRSLSGTNVSRDFVEMPSQIMENWARHPEMMRLYAQHYQTGDTIPEALINKIQAASNYGQGFMNTELIAASLLDMDYHSLSEVGDLDPVAFEKNSMEKYGLIPSIISRYHSWYFQHIFSSSSGYDAGYYSYTWSAVLACDAFELFEEKGIFNREVASSFRHNILERGNTEELATLYRKFRGQDPDIHPLLRKRGLE